jgi:hypothetical protein
MQASTRPIAEPVEVRCPGCNALVYSRRHKLCGVCGDQLPADRLFSEAQALQIEELLRLERQQHRAWMKR